MQGGPWKVGELAKAAGLTVRTLHHYDQIGLLPPSHHTESGHRLYGRDDLARLQRIQALRQLGFSLDEIAGCLDRPEFAPLPLVRLHLAKVQEQLSEQHRLLAQLQSLERVLEGGREASVDELLNLLEGMAMIETYYTKEQLEQLVERKRQVGDERIREVEAAWPRLMAEVRDEMAKGTDPKDPKVQALAKRWAGLLAEFTGGDPGIERSLKTMYLSEPSAPAKFGMPADMLQLAEYIRRASA